MKNMDVDDDNEETDVIERPDVESRPGTTYETAKDELPPATSLIESLLAERNEEIDEKRGKKKKKVKTGREKELERLTKATKNVFNCPHELNIACERIHSLLSSHKTILMNVCRSLDKAKSGRLPYEQFRLVIRDRLPSISTEDIFILTKLFERDNLIDYRAILDQRLGNGILRHITSLSVPSAKDIILETKPPKNLRLTSYESLHLNHTRYVTVHLRFIPFDSYNAYPGHISLTVPDHISIYALSKMIIDERDFATRSLSLFREKMPSKTTLLDPMHSLADHRYTGAYTDDTHNQPFTTYTLYYDFSTVDVGNNCPILKCDYYMK